MCKFKVQHPGVSPICCVVYLIFAVLYVFSLLIALFLNLSLIALTGTTNFPKIIA